MNTQGKRKYSRRKAFRFSCQELSVQYRSAYDDREAHLINISTTGCLLRDPGHELSVGEKILLLFPLWQDKPPIEANGHIARIRGDDVAVHFKVIEPDAISKIRLFIFRDQGNTTPSQPTPSGQ